MNYSCTFDFTCKNDYTSCKLDLNPTEPCYHLVSKHVWELISRFTVILLSSFSCVSSFCSPIKLGKVKNSCNVNRVIGTKNILKEIEQSTNKY